MIEQKVLNIFYRMLEIEKDRMTSEELFSLEIDSMTFIKIVIEIEEEFNIELIDELLIYSGKDCFDRICNFINEKVYSNAENC